MTLTDDQERRAMELDLYLSYYDEDSMCVRINAAARELIYLRDEVEELRLVAGTCLTLTLEQIRDLAGFAGIICKCPTDPDEPETEITIIDCPKKGLLNEDDGSHDYYDFVAYCAEYPEEGYMGLGKPKELPA